MPLLDQIYAHLDATEKSKLLVHVERQNAAKELELTRMMLQENPPRSAEMKNTIYPPTGEDFNEKKQRDAYNALRKQAMSRVFQWISQTRVDSRLYSDARIYTHVVVGKLMLERNAVDTAATLLKQAESMAIGGRHYDILEIIYCLFVDYAEEMKLPVQKTIDLWKANRKKHDRMCELQQTHALQRERIRKAKQKGKVLDPVIAYNRIRREIKVTLDDANDPAFLSLYLKILRSAIVAGKDYIDFERVVRRIYFLLKNRGVFKPGDWNFEVNMLYMYAHAAYRNRHFADAEEACRRISELLNDRDARNHPLYPKYMGVRANVATLFGKNQEAIELMEAALEVQVPTAEIGEWRSNQLNLAVFYFQACKFRKANKILISIEGSDTELEEQMGMEWCFKKLMIVLIVQYELGNDDLSLKMCKQVEEKFSEMLDEPLYKRAKIFLGFIIRMILDPNSVKTPEFHADVLAAKLAWPGYKEDIQAISFFCWIKSKMTGRDYYEVLIERINEGIAA